MNARYGDRRPRGRADQPWVIRSIVVVAAVLVVGGIVWAALLGHLF